MNPSVLFVFILSALLGVLRAADLAFGTDAPALLATARKDSDISALSLPSPKMAMTLTLTCALRSRCASTHAHRATCRWLLSPTL